MNPTMNDGDSLRLDGNSAAGILSEIFTRDITASRAVCAGCGAVGDVGALLVYAHGMGTVLRCSYCAQVVLRIARTPTSIWLDATGAKSIVIRASR